MGQEQKLYNISDSWNIHLKKFLIALGLFFAAFLMIMAWIFHLNYEHQISYIYALGLSILFVIFEFLINTLVTRYAVNKKIFTQAQLATLSIIFGVLFIFVVGFFLKALVQSKQRGTLFKNEIKKTFQQDFTVKDILGLILIAIGAFLVLYEF